MRPEPAELRHWRRLADGRACGDTCPVCEGSNRGEERPSAPDATEERWTHLDGVTFAQTVNRARRGIVRSVKRRDAEGCVTYAPEVVRANDAMVTDAIHHLTVAPDTGEVSVSYLSLGDLTPPLTGEVPRMPGMREVGHRTSWSRWDWRAHKGQPGLTVKCPCGEVYGTRDGHPEPSGDYWRRCVRYVLNPRDAEAFAARQTAGRDRVRRHRERRKNAPVASVTLDARMVTSALIRARIGVLPTD